MVQTPIQRTILWVVFGMSLLLLWDKYLAFTGQPSLFGAPSKTATTPAGSGGATTAAGAKAGDKPNPAVDASIPAASGTAGSPGNGSAVSPPAGATQPPTAADASQAVGSKELIELKNDVLSLKVDAMGGQVRSSELLRHTDIEDSKRQVSLLEDKPGALFYAQSGWVGNSANGSFPNHRSPFAVLEKSPSQVVLAAESGGLKVVRTYALKPGEYVLSVKDVVSNTSAAALQPTLYMQLTRDTHKPPGESQFYSTYTGPVFYTDKGKFQKVDFSEIEKNKATFEKSAADGWAGVIQHYFVVAWIPADKAAREYYADKVDTNLYRIGAKQTLEVLVPGANATVESRLLAGPQDQQMLNKIAPGLELTVDYGYLSAIAKPIFWLLEWCHKLVGNWGWAIVLLTLIIKTAFFPLQAASYKSMARMKAVTPRMTAIRERYGSDRAKMNQAMMELYKTEKINPLGGCLPIAVQIPVFISLYWVLLASVEMRNAPWVGWIKDLAAPDPYYILPLIMAVTMFIQTKLNPTPPDPIQAKMMTIMPLVFSVMFFFFPSGLVLYWLVNNVYSIVQQWVITRKIEAAAKKPT